jgi:hypothetical protein
MGRTGNEGYARAKWGKLSAAEKAAIQERLSRPRSWAADMWAGKWLECRVWEEAAPADRPAQVFMSQSDRVTIGDKDNRYGRGRCLRRYRCGGTAGYDHGHAAADEIGRKRRQPIEFVLRIQVLDRHVLALNMAGFLQALEEWNDEEVVAISGLRTEERPTTTKPVGWNAATRGGQAN